MRSRSVLIVDDHSGFRAAVRELLGRCGYDVIGEAADGGSALHASAELRPAVVLLDIQLPGMDGFEVARRLLAAGGGPDIVLVSTREARDYGTRIRDSGALGFISKSNLSADTLDAILQHATGVPAT